MTEQDEKDVLEFIRKFKQFAEKEKEYIRHILETRFNPLPSEVKLIIYADPDREVKH